VALNALRRVQTGMVSLLFLWSAPLVLWRLETIAITFSFTRSSASILGKVNGGSFEENSTWSAVVSRADRACCAVTSGLQQGKGAIKRHGRYDSALAAHWSLSSRTVGFGGW
jgi:hypothetical protein